MVHATPHKPSPVLCSLTVLMIVPDLCITCSKIVLLRSMSRLQKACSTKAKEKGKDFLMIYHNTPLTGSLQSLMQILKGRNARSDLPMSNAATKQLGIQPEVIRNSKKHAALPIYDLHVGQHVVFQDSTSKHWYPAVIKSLCPEPRNSKILK